MSDFRWSIYLKCLPTPSHGSEREASRQHADIRHSLEASLDVLNMAGVCADASIRALWARSPRGNVEVSNDESDSDRERTTETEPEVGVTARLGRREPMGQSEDAAATAIRIRAQVLTLEQLANAKERAALERAKRLTGSADLTLLEDRVELDRLSLEDRRLVAGYLAKRRRELAEPAYRETAAYLRWKRKHPQGTPEAFLRMRRLRLQPDWPDSRELSFSVHRKRSTANRRRMSNSE